MKIGKPEIGERRAIDESLQDGNFDHGEIDFPDLQDDEDGGVVPPEHVDPDDLEMLGYGPSMAEVFGAVDSVRDRVFGVDFAYSYVDEALRSPDGSVCVDDINASELLLDDGGGNPNFRTLGKSFVSRGFQILDQRTLKSWSRVAPKPVRPSGVKTVRSVDLGQLMVDRDSRDARRMAVYRRDGLAD